jgi:hypothetical protein
VFAPMRAPNRRTPIGNPGGCHCRNPRRPHARRPDRLPRHPSRHYRRRQSASHRALGTCLQPARRARISPGLRPPRTPQPRTHNDGPAEATRPPSNTEGQSERHHSGRRSDPIWSHLTSRSSSTIQ